MKTHSLSLSFAFSLFFCAVAAEAEFTECNGVWTNQPCEGAVRQTLVEHTSRKTPDEVARSEKSSLLHEFTMKSIRAREDYEIRFDLKSLREYCLEDATSVADCKRKIEKAESDLDKKMLRESRLVDERKKRIAEEERAKIERTQTEANATSVTIIDRDFIRGPRGFSSPRDYVPGQYPVQPPNLIPPQQGGGNANGYVDSRGYYVPRPGTGTRSVNDN